MRILIVTNNYTPYSGGVVSSLNAFIPEMQRIGHEVLLVAPQFLVLHADDPVWVRRVPSYVRFTWHNNRMAVPWRSERYLSKIIQEYNPDIVHVQHPFLLGVTAVKVARLHHVPVVFTYHTMYEAYAHYVPLPEILVRRCIVSLVKRFCNRVDMIIAPGNVVQKLLYERGMIPPIKVIPSPLQKIFLRDHQHKEKQNNRLVLLSVGRFTPEKNMYAILDLYSQLPRDRFRLVLVGYGVLYTALQDYAYKTLQFSQVDVQFVHKPSQAEIAQWYTDADIFLFTSQTDTQGLVLVEAMAGGLPVLALSGPGQQEVIRDGVNGFICETLTDMRDNIMQLADNAQQRKLLRIGASETAQKYRSEVLAQKVVRLYEQCVRE